VKTKELIAALQKEDPSGELEVVAGSTPIYFVECQPAYYDGYLEMLIRDPNRSHEYNIIGYKVTSKGDKVKLHLMDVIECIANDPALRVDTSDLSEHRQIEWQQYINSKRFQND
jgi:hypothetical protein